MKDANKADLWWFANKYPDYKDIAKVLGTISEIEYGELDTTDLDAVKKYVESWPDSRHSAGLKKMLQFEQMIRKADLAAIFAYIEANGYTADYPRMVRAIARVHDALILTPDIREVDLVRFRDSKGNVGYWSKNGAVAIARVRVFRKEARVGLHGTIPSRCPRAYSPMTPSMDPSS